MRVNTSSLQTFASDCLAFPFAVEPCGVWEGCQTSHYLHPLSLLQAMASHMTGLCSWPE